jgi:hypothetical protein
MPGPTRFDAYVEAVLLGDKPAMRQLFSAQRATQRKLVGMIVPSVIGHVAYG